MKYEVTNIPGAERSWSASPLSYVGVILILTTYQRKGHAVA
jgi:hypothetical protein